MFIARCRERFEECSFFEEMYYEEISSRIELKVENFALIFVFILKIIIFVFFLLVVIADSDLSPIVNLVVSIIVLILKILEGSAYLISPKIAEALPYYFIMRDVSGCFGGCICPTLTTISFQVERGQHV